MILSRHKSTISHECAYHAIRQDKADGGGLYHYLRYFPKDRDFTTITQKEMDRFINRLKNLTRKCLAIKIPDQVFSGSNPAVVLES